MCQVVCVRTWQAVYDLMINLFKGYMAASDNMFFQYVDHKRDASDNGEEVYPNELMNLALNNFKMVKKSETWNALSAD